MSAQWKARNGAEELQRRQTRRHAGPRLLTAKPKVKPNWLAMIRRRLDEPPALYCRLTIRLADLEIVDIILDRLLDRHTNTRCTRMKGSMYCSTFLDHDETRHLTQLGRFQLIAYLTANQHRILEVNCYGS